MSPTANPTQVPTATPTEQPTYKERHSHEEEHIRKANNAAIVMVVFAVLLFGGFFVTIRRCFDMKYGKHHVVSASLAFDDVSSESGSGGKGDKIDKETKVKPSSQKSESSSSVNGEGSSITDYCTKNGKRYRHGILVCQYGPNYKERVFIKPNRYRKVKNYAKRQNEER
jgi:hypothetical protein